MKKLISLIIAVCICLFMISGCASVPSTDTGRLSVVATVFPEYDWVMRILGEKSADTDVTMLLDSGVDLHSYQPTAADIVKVSSCDLFIYVGGESDEWVDDVLKEAVNENMVIISLLDVLGNAAKEEETVEGMEAEEEEEGETEYDEHVWLSLKNAVVFVNAIKDALAEADPENASVYAANAEAYISELNDLDAQYRKAVSEAKTKTVLFGDRFPFRYLTDDYGLTYYAAFSGCSAESEASFETVTFLASKVDELGLGAVLTLEGADKRIAETVVSATKSKDAKILSMDSMQSLTMKDVENGVTYISVMEKNLEVLKQALD